MPRLDQGAHRCASKRVLVLAGAQRPLEAGPRPSAPKRVLQAGDIFQNDGVRVRGAVIADAAAVARAAAVAPRRLVLSRRLEGYQQTVTRAFLAGIHFHAVALQLLRHLLLARVVDRARPRRHGPARMERGFTPACRRKARKRLSGGKRKERVEEETGGSRNSQRGPFSPGRASRATRRLRSPDSSSPRPYDARAQREGFAAQTPPTPRLRFLLNPRPARRGQRAARRRPRRLKRAPYGSHRSRLDGLACCFASRKSGAGWRNGGALLTVPAAECRRSLRSPRNVMRGWAALAHRSLLFDPIAGNCSGN